MIYREEKNFIEAASNGASLAISLVANIAANLIAFIALLHFVDSTLTWMGHRAGLYEPELTFRVNLCSTSNMAPTKTFLNSLRCHKFYFIIFIIILNQAVLVSI